jgi:hypothetical protein
VPGDDLAPGTWRLVTTWHQAHGAWYQAPGAW